MHHNNLKNVNLGVIVDDLLLPLDQAQKVCPETYVYNTTLYVIIS